MKTSDRFGGPSIMLKPVLVWAGIVLAAVGSFQVVKGQQSAKASPAPAVQYRAVLDRYCVTCHNERLKTAGLMLDKMDLDRVPESAEVWEKVLRKLAGGMMPPLGAP